VYTDTNTKNSSFNYITIVWRKILTGENNDELLAIC